MYSESSITGDESLANDMRETKNMSCYLLLFLSTVVLHLADIIDGNSRACVLCQSDVSLIKASFPLSPRVRIFLLGTIEASIAAVGVLETFLAYPSAGASAERIVGAHV